MNRSLTTCLLAGGLLMTTAAFAASPPAPPAPAAVEAPAPPAPPSPPAATGIAEVEAAVRAWAAAWSARDADRYLAAYAPDFTPPRNKDRKRWETDRRARIANKSSISVGIEDLVISVNGQSASARFKQVYRADKLKETGRKTLELQRVGNQWLIRKESAGG
jgi:ketosteroid isomerase-like protein